MSTTDSGLGGSETNEFVNTLNGAIDTSAQVVLPLEKFESLVAASRSTKKTLHTAAISADNVALKELLNSRPSDGLVNSQNVSQGHGSDVESGLTHTMYRAMALHRYSVLPSVVTWAPVDTCFKQKPTGTCSLTGSTQCCT